MRKLFNNVKKHWFTPLDSDSPRVNNFNLIRFLAALMVIYGHTFALTGNSGGGIFSQAASTTGVKILFAISGYLVTVSYMKDRNVLRYAVRRVFRIFPALIAVTLFAVLIVGPKMTTLPIGEYFGNPQTLKYLKNILLSPVYSLPGVFGSLPSTAVNGSLWTLPIEFALYIFLPLIIFIFDKLHILKTGIIVTAIVSVVIDIVFIGSGQSISFVLWGTDWCSGLFLASFFFVGSMFAMPGMKSCLNLQAASVMLLVTSMLSLTSVQSEIIMLIVVPYFTFSFAYAKLPLFWNWFSKNDFSYGLYLFAFPIQQCVIGFTRSRNLTVSPNKIAVICILLTFVCAVISWFVIERPTQLLSKKITGMIKSKETVS